MYHNGSFYYNWKFPKAVDSSNTVISEPYFQTRYKDNKLFDPGTTTVTIAFRDKNEVVERCTFTVIVRKYKIIYHF